MDGVRDRPEVVVAISGPLRDVPGRLLARDPARCSDADLLGILLDGGAGGSATRALAERLLEASGGVARLERLDGTHRALLGARWRRRLVVLRAGLELGRRAGGIGLASGAPIRDASVVWKHFRGRLPQLERETFFVLLLDGRNRVQDEVRVSEGTLSAALVHPREVFSTAVRLGAAGLILVHNHPSGDPTPSAEDQAITERLRTSGDLIGIRVLDHVVIGHAGYVSMAERGRWW
jgi:DNA repair protein RadC